MLRQYRAKYQLVQADLAKEIGIITGKQTAQSIISKIENGVYPINDEVQERMLSSEFRERMRRALEIELVLSEESLKKIIEAHNKKDSPPLYQLLDIKSLWTFDFSKLSNTSREIDIDWQLSFNTKFLLNNFLKPEKSLYLSLPPSTTLNLVEAVMHKKSTKYEEAEEEQGDFNQSTITIIDAVTLQQKIGDDNNRPIHTYNSDRWLYIDFKEMKKFTFTNESHYRWKIKFKAKTQPIKTNTGQEKGFFFYDQGFGYVPFEPFSLDIENIQALFLFDKKKKQEPFFSVRIEHKNEFPGDVPSEFRQEEEGIEYYYLPWKATGFGSQGQYQIMISCLES